jgi:hypothetical protein
VAYHYENQKNKELNMTPKRITPIFWEGKGKGIQEIAKFLE